MAMDTAFRAGLLGLRYSELTNSQSPLLLRGSLLSHTHGVAKRSLCVSVIRSSLPGREAIGDDVMRIFLKDRQLNGDFISKVSDMLWQRDNLMHEDSEISLVHENSQQHDEMLENESRSGYLKLTRAREWVSGDNVAPAKKKFVVKERQKDSEKRKKLNLLKYEALKRELLLLTTGIGAACSAYCLVNLSVQAAISYASGVLFSCLYLQLLYHHTDNLSRAAVAEAFMQKKLKKIGIRSEDLKNVLEKTLSGTTLALSSPRLVIPAAIYGIWALSHHFLNSYFDFQLVPGMFGFFAYKAAALVQVYRDNEDLQFVFPDNEEGSDNS
ncbi:uncharacterized protein LOC103718349 isoform X3 [Phoenix dactylifera]|uniref:Uncharacterized protein LOC103718349 isoform X3 n=1 Tax=Phoenix dactylifera TaxID=42345 RepID=A0A8B7CSB6_PHODC|nr:uncharacterized protein LOC103718349 isoform X3 [Phoenix dactylifera]